MVLYLVKYLAKGMHLKEVCTQSVQNIGIYVKT